MKKTSAILTVMMVFLCSAFCTSLREAHDIRLMTKIDTVTPVFQLVFTRGMKDPSESVIVNKIGNPFEDGADYNEYASDDSAIEVADISRDDLDLLFTVRLANDAKSTNLYTLKFIAGAFAVTRNSVPGSLLSSNPVVAASSDLSSREGIVSGLIVTEESIQLRFTGSRCNPGDLATFAVHYNADRTLDPSKDSFYYADISLEISSDS